VGVGAVLADARQAHDGVCPVHHRADGLLCVYSRYHQFERQWLII
jgi:hypothetical protein